jgi:DNA-binding protein HU-beta
VILGPSVGFENAGASKDSSVHEAREAQGVIKQDIVNRLVERSGVSENTAEQVFDALFNSMKGAMARGERIELRGFGVFTVVPRKTGLGRNPRTGEQMPIPVGRTVRFKPGKELRPREKDNL